MKNFSILEFDEFLRSVEISKTETFALLLGAGASISSGIQSAYDCIWEWKKDIYISNNPNAPEWMKNHKLDQVREVLQKWLDNEGSYLPLDHPDEYSFYVERCYKIEEDRRKYFQGLSIGKQPSIGYRLICPFFEAGIIQAIWTTNFDNLTLKAAAQTNITAIDITLDTVDRIHRPDSQKELLHIGLHGDYRYGPLKNTDKELKQQDETFREKLVTYLNDRHLIVSGYSGRDQSLMDALFEVYGKKGSGRLYWCGYGRTVRPEIEALINHAKANGRSAFFVPTDGFDKTMISLAQVCLRDNLDFQSKIDQLFRNQDEEINTTPFSISFHHLNNIIKSNAFPVQIPDELFKFEFEFSPGESHWEIVRTCIAGSDVTAVPFKGFIWAFGRISDIKKCFSQRIKGQIKRAPSTEIRLHEDTAIYHLQLAALTKVLAKNSNLNSNGKDLIWRRESKKQTKFNGVIYSIFEGIRLSFHFDREHYVVLLPDFFVEAEIDQIPKEARTEIGRTYFEKIYNKPFNEYINSWREELFKQKDFEIDYPLNSELGFTFKIKSIPAFAEIMDASSKKGINLSPKFPRKFIKYQGIHFQEPKLVFAPKHSEMREMPKDFHPMRGLTNNRPYDFPLTGKIFGSEIRLGVICPRKDANEFNTFLNKQLQTISTNNINKEYLIEFPSFFKAYGIGINIPEPDQEQWLDCPEPEEKNSIQKTALSLMRSIKSGIESLTVDGKNIVVVIFIPARWNHLLSYSIEGEEFDLHDYIKAYGAERGIATQFIQEDTVKNHLQCQINWWLSLSYYVKSMRTPWILDSIDKNTAFAGIGYSIDRYASDKKIVLGCSHIYNSQGQGLKYKLSKVEEELFWDRQRNPHLSYNDAFRFGVSIVELFYNAMNSLPKRVVIHKRTYFTRDEIDGIRDSLSSHGVEKIDLIEITFEDNLRYVASKISQEGFPKEPDSYPVQRGISLVLNNRSALLWSHGVVPSVRNPNYRYYLGGRYIPGPLRITKHLGEGNIGQIANEILGLSKMNWNSFDLYSQLPATISSSNEIARIGKLLSNREGIAYDYRYFI